MALTFQKGQGDKIYITKMTRNDNKVVNALSVNDKVYYWGLDDLFKFNLTPSETEYGIMFRRAQTNYPREIIIPSTYKGLPVTEIDASAFRGADKVTKIIIPDSIVRVGYRAFYNCTNLKKLVLPDSVKVIEREAFYKSRFDSVVLGKGITTIEVDALVYVSKYYYKGTGSDWSKITIGTGNDVSKVYYYSTTKPTTEGNYWHYVDGEIIEWGSDCENGHTWERTSCTTPLTCSVCGDTKGEGFEHTWSDWEITKRQNCTEAGKKTRTCSVCGKQESEACGTALGHDYGDCIDFVIASSCVGKGYTKYECLRCGDVHYDYSGGEGHHSGTEGEVVAPTCTEKGYTVYVCDECGEDYKADEKAPLGHSWSDWAIVLEPTCANTGTKRRDCSRCGAYETETVATLEHNYTSVVTAPTCTEQGYTTHTCSTCGDSYHDSYTNTIKHNWGDWGFDIGLGLSSRKCEVCGTTEKHKILEFTSIGDDKYSVRVNRGSILLDGLSEGIEIPSLDGKVTMIEEDGFKNCTGIKYIVLPDSITTIGDSAFENCYDLERVQIGRESKLTSIGRYAFYNCYPLTQIVLPKSLDYVGFGAFNNKWCAFLYEGNSTDWKTYAPTVLVPVLTDNLYYYTDNSVSAAGSSDTYWKYVDNSPEIVYGASDVGHFTFTELDDGTYSVKATDVSKLPEYVYIPKEYNGKAVTKIDEEGFAYNEKVKFYEIPDTIIEIGTRAFAEHIRLSEVRFSFGSRLKTIGIAAFEYNDQLATLSSPKASIGEFPSCVTTMLYNAFYYCEKLTKAVIPPKVTTAHEFVFSSCTSVETIELNNVKHINRSAFWGCSPISLDIPASVEFIDNTAFGNCSKTLESITVDEDNQYYYVEGNCLIRKSDNALLLGCANSEIPETVKSIVAGAFYGNTYFAPIKIPLSVETIESLAFCGEIAEPVKVYCAATSKPPGWADDWYGENVEVVWGYTDEGDTCTHSYTSVVTSPTCTEQGYTEHTCSKCGDSYKDTYVDALGHDWSLPVIIKPATCLINGKQEVTCSRCLTKEIQPIPATGHDYKSVVTPPTCTEQGYTTYTCAKCGGTYKDNYVDALGHISSDWIIDTEATETAEGGKHKECTRCGVVLETATIPMLDNNTYLVTESGEYLTDEQGNLLIL